MCIIQPTHDNSEFRVIPEGEIIKELKNLKRNNSSGLENFLPGMLKNAAGVIAKPLTHIINLSLRTGTIPTDWKAAKVIPLLKSGSLADINSSISFSNTVKTFIKENVFWGFRLILF